MITTVLRQGDAQRGPARPRGQHRLLRAALVPLVGIAVALGAGACGEKTGAGKSTASAGDPSRAVDSTAKRPSSWTDYDKKMEKYAECLRKNGMAGARYNGHKSSAKEPSDELSGLPKDNNQEYPAITKCHKYYVTEFERPEPFAPYTRSPQELADERAMARCIRQHGVSDYPDPVADFNGLSNAEKDARDKFDAKNNPTVAQAMQVCSKELGTKNNGAGG